MDDLTIIFARIYSYIDKSTENGFLNAEQLKIFLSNLHIGILESENNEILAKMKEEKFFLKWKEL